MNTLGAAFFIYNGDKFDYNYRETIENMKAFADQVVVLAIESEDGSHLECKTYDDYKTKVVIRSEEEWKSFHGKTKLAHFQNEAKNYLETDYWMLVQSDEILHERSFKTVREAVNVGLEAYMCTRYNLWKDAYHMLNVPQERKPCSTEVIRLAKTKYNSVDDGENIDCPRVCFDLIKEIEIFHMGYVRKPDIMKNKVIHMLEEVFLTPHDAKLDEDEVFNPAKYFDLEKDLVPIKGPLPKHIQKWAEDRWGMPQAQ